MNDYSAKKDEWQNNFSVKYWYLIQAWHFRHFLLEKNHYAKTVI